MESVLHISAVLSAIIALYLLGSRSEPRQAHRRLAAVCALLATQQALPSLALMEAAAAWVWWRPVLAMLLPPLIYLHLRAVTHPEVQLHWPDLPHLAAPVGLLLLRGVLPDGPYLDAAIISSQAFYGVLALLRITAPTQATRRWKLLLCAWLLAMAIADLLVMIELVGRDTLGQSRSLIIVISGLFIFLVYVLLTSLHRSGPLSWITTRMRREAAGSQGIAAQLEQHMTGARPWLDPELTVARLARQLSLPQRRVSETVNDAYGVSVSRWINGWRITEAQRLMAADPARPLVELMLDCGFQTRSNFNKAFSDVTGETPSAWRKAHCQPKPGRAP
jgi:AraC-like DNA-binding protein